MCPAQWQRHAPCKRPRQARMRCNARGAVTRNGPLRSGVDHPARRGGACRRGNRQAIPGRGLPRSAAPGWPKCAGRVAVAGRIGSRQRRRPSAATAGGHDLADSAATAFASMPATPSARVGPGMPPCLQQWRGPTRGEPLGAAWRKAGSPSRATRWSPAAPKPGVSARVGEPRVGGHAGPSLRQRPRAGVQGMRAAGWRGRRSRRPWWPVPPRPRQARPPRQWPAGLVRQTRPLAASGSRSTTGCRRARQPRAPRAARRATTERAQRARCDRAARLGRRGRRRYYLLLAAEVWPQLSGLLPRGAAGACRWQCCRRRDLGRRGPCRGLRRWGVPPGRADLRQAVRTERNSLFLC